MISNVIQSQGKQKILCFGLMSIIVLLMIGFYCYAAIVSSSVEVRSPFTVSVVKYILLTTLLATLCVALGLLFIRLSAAASADALMRSGRTSMIKDYASLTTAMAELAQGNLSQQMAVQSKPIHYSTPSERNEFFEIFNDMIRSLEKTAEEFNKLTDTPCLRLCYVGADSFLEGRRCGEVMGETVGGKGEVAIITISLIAYGLELRRKGFENLLRENYPEVKIVDVVESNESLETVYDLTVDLLKRYPHLAGIYVDNGGAPPEVARATVEAKKTGKVKIICHDLTDETMRYVQQRVISATLGQDPFVQGHDPVIHLFNHLVDGWKPHTPYLLTRMDVVTPENYHRFWDSDRGVIQSQDALDRLAKPVDKQPSKHFRIAVLGRYDSPFWYPVKDGVLAAAEELKPYNTTVEWILPEEPRGEKEITTSVYGVGLESLLEQEYDGIATISSDREQVPYINRAVKAGVPVITFNSEPSSLRNLLFNITEQAQRLMGMSQHMASSIHQVSQTTLQIKNAMNELAHGAASQNEEVDRTRETLKTLLGLIDRVNREAEKGMDAAAGTAEAVSIGTEAMGETLSTIQTIEKSVSDTWHIVEELNKQSDRIDVIVELIDDITSRINVLGLNASIEAFCAGEYGKGFLVVADEIRKLAKSTIKSTDEIFKLVSTIQAGIGQVEKFMADDLRRVKESAGLTDKAVVALGNIRQLMETDKQRMRDITSTMNEMQKSSRQVGEAMENVATVSKKNSSVVGEVNVSTNEMSTQLEVVADFAKSLEKMAQAEQELLTKFNLSGNGKK